MENVKKGPARFPPQGVRKADSVQDMPLAEISRKVRQRVREMERKRLYYETRWKSIRDYQLPYIGIFDGDQVIVEKTSTARNGEIVVALVEDSATVKRFFKENGHYRLQPENDSMDPIIVPEVQILGKVVGLFRRMM